jgi:signal transduction histidine kinase
VKVAVEGKGLRVLIVEDTQAAADILVQRLQEGGQAVVAQRVANGKAMRAALTAQSWDVIISACALRRFDAPAALAVMKAEGLDLPFIIVSDGTREDLAVQAMREGAHDYFLKENLGPRLVAAIEREVQEAAVRAENSRMHEHLLISDCLASMGALAAGVAHEINNPLTSVLANIDLATASLEQMSQDRESQEGVAEMVEGLRDAREAATRIKNIVRDIKIFSRPLSEKVGPINVERVMESTLRMAWNEIRYRTRLFKSYNEAPAVEASESSLGQVFLSLVVNAAHAMSEEGGAENKLTLSIGSDEKGFAVIEVKDTGPGISPEDLTRVFQPRFAGRNGSANSGVALSICHRIVMDLRGELTVASELGKGTTFRVRLPPATAQPAVGTR